MIDQKAEPMSPVTPVICLAAAPIGLFVASGNTFILGLAVMAQLFGLFVVFVAHQSRAMSNWSDQARTVVKTLVWVNLLFVVGHIWLIFDYYYRTPRIYS